MQTICSILRSPADRHCLSWKGAIESYRLRPHTSLKYLQRLSSKRIFLSELAQCPWVTLIAGMVKSWHCWRTMERYMCLTDLSRMKSRRMGAKESDGAARDSPP